MVKKRRQASNLRVTGRSVAYVQSVGARGKLSKAKPIVITTVASGPQAGVQSPVRRRKRR